MMLRVTVIFLLIFTTAFASINNSLRIYADGVQLENDKKIDLAIDLYKKVLVTAPYLTEVLVRLGICQLRMYKIDEAIETFNQLLQNPETSALAYRYLGWCYLNRSDFQKALVNFEKAWGSSSGNFFSELDLGIIYSELRINLLAREHLQKALLLNPNSSLVYTHLGKLYLREGQLEKALPFIEKAIELDPDNAWAHNEMGVYYFKKKDFPNAVSEFAQSLKLVMEYKDTSLFNIARAENNLGLVFFEQGNFSLSYLHLQKALEVDPLNPAPYNNVSWFFALKDVNLDKALEYANKALELDPVNPAYWDTLGEVYYKLGKLDKAKEALDKAIQLEPENEEYKEHLQKILQSKNKKN